MKAKIRVDILARNELINKKIVDSLIFAIAAMKAPIQLSNAYEQQFTLMRKKTSSGVL